jgi:hypothetical protein
MVSPQARARRELLHRLLEQYERSRAFGRTEPWARDVILPIDARRFPEAFHPDGRETLAAFRAAAEELAAAGAVRIARHRGYAAGVPHEVRIGPRELEIAYRLAVADGFEPLADALAALRGHARAIRRTPGPHWLGEFLFRVEEGATKADLSTLGTARDRFKRERRDVLDALTACAALAAGDAGGWQRVVSERLFGDSKRLGVVRARVVDFLIRADPRWDGLGPDDASELLEAYGVRRKPAVLQCAGSAALYVAGREYRLEDFRPTAHVPGDWASAWIEALSSPAVACITTIENEFPYLAYVEDAGGPAGLGLRGEIVVYTAGFPTPVLSDSLAEIARRNPRVHFRHWGDADAGGLRIWWLLRTRLGCPVALFRTTADWVRTVSALGGGKPLEPSDRSALRRLRAQLATGPWTEADDVRTVLAVLETLLTSDVKLEQERY